MIIIRRIIIWIVVFFLAIVVLNDVMHIRGGDSAGFGAVVIATIAVFFDRYRQMRNNEGRTFSKKVIAEDITSSIAETASSVKSFKASIDSKMHNEGENDLFALAETEVDENRQNKGLWSKALIQANGDESRRKIEYMKLRAKQLGE